MTFVGFIQFVGPTIMLLLGLYAGYKDGKRDGIREGRALAEAPTAQTYNRAREEGWQAGYAEGLEDAGK